MSKSYGYCEYEDCPYCKDMTCTYSPNECFIDKEKEEAEERWGEL